MTSHATEMMNLADTATLAPPITSRDPAFTVEDAYRVSAEVLSLRESAGWRRAGRKIGFTNRTILEQYGVYQPIFGYMYDRTLVYAEPEPGTAPTATSLAGTGGAAPAYPVGPGSPSAQPVLRSPLIAHLSLSTLAQPRIEPEIAFKLRAAPESRDPEALLACIEWLAHGFEIVQCHFPDWRFAAADTVADGGLHGRYVVGPRLPVHAADPATLAAQLARFRISLLQDGNLAAEGGGELVLGSPLNALALLLDVLAAYPAHPTLAPGEIITTGTLTAALPVLPGQTWSTLIEGLPLPGFTLSFG